MSKLNFLDKEINGDCLVFLEDVRLPKEGEDKAKDYMGRYGRQIFIDFCWAYCNFTVTVLLFTFSDYAWGAYICFFAFFFSFNESFHMI